MRVHIFAATIDTATIDSIVPGVDMKRFRILHYAKCNHCLAMRKR